jgi:hypothetical protein
MSLEHPKIKLSAEFKGVLYPFNLKSRLLAPIESEYVPHR